MAVMDGYISWVVSDKPTSSPIGTALHSQINCPSVRKPENLVLVRAEADGDKVTVNHRGLSATVKPCAACPPSLKWGWQDRAACKNAYPEDDLVFIGPSYQATSLIEKYCNQCPVILECLQFVEDQGLDATGVWGGLYFPNDKNAGRDTRGLNKRKEQIDAQRTRIEQGLFSR